MTVRISDVADRRVPGVRRIAVLRANAVGDFVLTLPALEALKATYPDATLALVGKRWHARFLEGRAGPVDEVVPLPDVPGVTVPAAVPAAVPTDVTGDVRTDRSPDRALPAFLARMRARHFDLALQLHGGGRYSNPLVLAFDARVTAGFQAPDAAPLARNFPYVPPDIDLHPRALLLRECVALVGAESPVIEPRLALRADDVAELRRQLPGLEGPLAVLQPGATDPRRRWHPHRFAAVGDALAAQGLRVVVNGDAAEAALTASVRDAMRQPALDAGGKLSLGGLCALLASARLLVSNDTGPAHLARALGLPTVTLYWIGNLHSYGPLSARWHRVAVSYRIHCPVCGAPNLDSRCHHAVSFVDDIQTDAVIELAMQLYRDSLDDAQPSATEPARSR